MIDEEALETAVRDLRVSVLASQERTEKLTDCRSKLESICRPWHAGERGSNPPDPVTGQAMTDARRQEIYDACLTEAQRLIG